MQLIVGAYSSWADYDDKDWSDLYGGVDAQVRKTKRRREEERQRAGEEESGCTGERE